jgi:hypothetical protein
MNECKCSIPDCNEAAILKRWVSINNAPKELLPVCQIHADAADEDKPECICDDLIYGEYCEACDGPYEEWKEKNEADTF